MNLTPGRLLQQEQMIKKVAFMVMIKTEELLSFGWKTGGAKFGNLRKELFKRMEIKGVDTAFLTLHMGLGNFRSVDVEDLSKHKMDSESLNIPEKTADLVNNAKRNGKRVFATGVTVLRGLETYVTTTEEIREFEGWTNKFIFPPYKVSIPTALITNFHMPCSTMLMSECAFGGFENVMKCYKAATEEGYRFGPYGDAMLII